jgi:hypothetical protein
VVSGGGAPPLQALPWRTARPGRGRRGEGEGEAAAPRLGAPARGGRLPWLGRALAPRRERAAERWCVFRAPVPPPPRAAPSVEKKRGEREWERRQKKKNATPPFPFLRRCAVMTAPAGLRVAGGVAKRAKKHAPGGFSGETGRERERGGGGSVDGLSAAVACGWTGKGGPGPQRARPSCGWGKEWMRGCEGGGRGRRESRLTRRLPRRRDPAPAAPPSGGGQL